MDRQFDEITDGSSIALILGRLIENVGGILREIHNLQVCLSAGTTSSPDDRLPDQTAYAVGTDYDQKDDQDIMENYL